MKKIKGKPVSAGIVMGKAFLLNSQKTIILREKIRQDLIDAEIKRFNSAVTNTRSQLKKIATNLQKTMGKDSALIIETQHLLLKEGALIEDIKNLIVSHSVKAEWAIREVEKKYIDFFNNIPDLSFREKRNDISDILNRLIGNLKESNEEIETTIENVILVADDMPPSVAAQLLSKGKLLGLVLDQGGETSHSVILARTLEIPTILDTKSATQLISNDDLLIIDGLSGEIFINPEKAFLSKYLIKKEKYQAYKERLKGVVKLPDITRDHYDFHLSANIELPFESDLVQSYGARGIGLYRTEFLFTDPQIAVSTEQQYLIYKNIAQKVFPNPVVIRTFDVGRDKEYGHFKSLKEVNPALGTMAVRLFLKEKKLFKTQIKAILMANESGNIKILFPMVTEIEEIYTIKNIMEESKAELREEKKLPDKKMEMGIMIEIPGTVKLIKYLKDDIDFFSIGTNDLIQYLLAVDRNNSSVSYLFNPFHPAVIEILFEIKREIDRIGKKVTVCGEIAGKGFTALMLLGMGYTHFSMNPLSIIEIKRIFTNIHYSYIKGIAGQLTTLSSKTEIEEFLIENIIRKYPELFNKQPVF
jgi:phosphotransferase system enzyme I (PtsI)